MEAEKCHHGAQSRKNNSHATPTYTPAYKVIRYTDYKHPSSFLDSF